MRQLLRYGPVAEVYAADGEALKVFPGRFDRRTLAAIERERSRLAGAPILPVTAVEVVDGKHALRMELCAGSLADRVRQYGPLTASEVTELCDILSRALAAAHRAGVCHGGVSPTNVLFRMTGEPVLADFGVAQRQAFRRDPLHGIEWVSPETLRSGEVDERSDYYGLGTVLHFALTGESPHPSRLGEQTSERILRVLREPVPAISRPDVPIGLSTMIGRLLAPDPEKRSAPWSKGAPADGTTPARRHVWWWNAALALALVAVVAIILWPRSPAAPAASESPSLSVSSQPDSSPSPGAAVTLAEPTDLGDRVSLTWTATDDRMYFAVGLWAEGEKTQWRLVEFDHTATMPVDPGRKYCFVVRGTVGGKVVESQSRAIRQADCRK